MTSTQLKKIRRRYGFTQADLARIIKVSNKTLYRYEAGGTIPVREQLHLAMTFHAAARGNAGKRPCAHCQGTGLEGPEGDQE